MRRLGVYGSNLPTKKEKSVDLADFSIAGLIGFFDRQYKKPFKCISDIEAQTIFGGQTNKNYYGWDCLNGFFANLKGQSGSVYILAPVGEDAVQASADVVDGAGANILTLKGAYLDEDEFGISANRTGYTITQGAFFETELSGSPSGSEIPVVSCAGLHIGDVVRLHYVGSSTGTDIYSIVTAVNESAKTITVSATVTITGTASDWVLQGMGFKLKIYRKSTTGIVSEVDKTLGNTWCTLNPEDPDHNVANVFKQSTFVKVIVNTTSSTTDKKLPAEVGTVTFLSGGTTGTLPANVASWKEQYKLFDNLPIRMIANCESSNDAVQSALENYCVNREDNPVAMLVGQYNMMSKQACITAGNYFQRSDEVDAVFVHNWVGVSNPFSDSPIAPDREVPAVGHLMGQWIYSIAQNGIHSSPARKTCPIVGVNSVIGFQATNDEERTELAENGVNVLQVMTGKGIVLRNSFTPSTAKEFRYSNAVIQRNFIKVSCVDSLQDSENTPNDIGSVREDRMAVLQFMNRLWRSGSNGNVKEGETFGQYEKDDGSTSTIEDAFEIIADATNNSVAQLQAGERNIDIWFMFPAPAGSIKVGVGLIYKTVG